MLLTWNNVDESVFGLIFRHISRVSALLQINFVALLLQGFELVVEGRFALLPQVLIIELDEPNRMSGKSTHFRRFRNLSSLSSSSPPKEDQDENDDNYDGNDDSANDGRDVFTIAITVAATWRGRVWGLCGTY